MKSIEHTRLELQASLDSLKSQKQRNVLGQFATPTDLASEILAQARTLLPAGSEIDFLDPAIGTGAFFSALISEFSKEDILSARGFEIDPHYGIPSMNLWKSSALTLELRDFTDAQPPASGRKPNLIICNPPYVRHHHLNAESKGRLAEKAVGSAQLSISGLAGLYCYFMAIAHAWLAEDGIAGWLIPSEFMDVNYGSALRDYLTSSVELLQIHRFNPTEMQFGDAQVSSAVVWFRKRRPTSDHLAQMSYGGTLSNPLHNRNVPIAELQRSKKWSGLAVNPIIAKTNRYTLSDFFRIKRGLATGDNNFFVMSETKKAELKIPSQFLKPLLPSPRHLDSDIVESDGDGHPLLAKKLYLLDCPFEEAKVRQLSPNLFKYFESGRSVTGKTYICSRRTPWYSQESRPPAPILCTYMGRGLAKKSRPFRFILNNSHATALNVYLLLYPTPLLENEIKINPTLLAQIWKILNNIPSSVLLGEGRVYGGGLYKMEPKELANLPADEIAALLPRLGAEKMRQTEMFTALVA